jgi:hypothetical protein
MGTLHTITYEPLVVADAWKEAFYSRMDWSSPMAAAF